MMSPASKPRQHLARPLQPQQIPLLRLLVPARQHRRLLRLLRPTLLPLSPLPLRHNLLLAMLRHHHPPPQRSLLRLTMRPSSGLRKLRRTNPKMYSA